MYSSLRVLFLASLTAYLPANLAIAGSIDDEKAIKAVLNAQVGAWNNGDIDSFMDGYWKDERVSGFSDGAEVKGWKALNERYKASYNSAGKEMGKLVFSQVSVDVLGSDAGVVHGKWELITSKGISRGHFTQVLRRFPEGWKITHDHSSR